MMALAELPHGRYFVTGTDTEIGKTHVSVAILRAWGNGGGVKPVESGLDELSDHERDSSRLRVASSDTFIQAVGQDWLVPQTYGPPLAPYAAEKLGLPAFDTARALSQRDHVRATWDGPLLVEGVGGLLAPLRRDFSVLDLAKTWELPLIVVVGNKLGCQNHARLTAQVAAQQDVDVAAWVLNDCQPMSEADMANDTNRPILAELVPGPWYHLAHTA